jgi:hydroxymethylbilane synthase
LSKLLDKKQKSVLITRQLSENIGTKKMLQDAGVNVSDVSFIRIELVEHQWKANFDWLFFTSPNAIEHFNALDRIPSGIKIGALGRGTSAALRLKNLSVAFEGDGTTQTVAANFKTVLGQEKALIICAENGLRNFQQGLNPESYQELAVYKTKVNPIKLGEVPPIVAFTSPSNVDGFFALNELPAQAKVIAIGTTTQKALAERNVKNVTVAWQSSEQALVDTILGLD